MNTTITKEKKAYIHDALPFNFFIIFLILLPYIIIPWFSSFEPVKSFFGIITSLILVMLWWFSLFKSRGDAQLPMGTISISWLTIVVTTLISLIFSINTWQSLTGVFLESGTVVWVLVLSFFLFFSAFVMRTRARVLYLYLILLCSSCVLLLFGIFDTLLFHWLSDEGRSLIGTSLDLSMMAGMTSLIALFSLVLSSLKGMYRIFLWVALCISIVILVLNPYKVVFALLGFISITFLITEKFIKNSTISHGGPIGTEKKKSTITLGFFFVVSILFVLTISTISLTPIKISVDTVNRGVLTSEMYTVTRNSLVEGIQPLLVGSGPNTFSYQWDKHKPLSVNTKPYWSDEVVAGSSLIPTLATTTGLLGLFSWVLLLFFIMFAGFRIVANHTLRADTAYFLIPPFLLSLYGILLMFVAVPGVVVTVYIVVMLGTFVGMLSLHNIAPSISLEKVLTFKRVIIVGFFVALPIISIGVYLTCIKFISIIKYEEAIKVSRSSENFAQAEALLKHATAFSPQPVFYRELSNIQLAEIRSLLSDTSIAEDEGLKLFTRLSEDAIENARLSIIGDNRDYRNLIAFGNIYAQLAVLSVDGAYTLALERYRSATWLNPYNPRPHLLISQLAAFSGETALSWTSLQQALALKPDYPEALRLRDAFEQQGN